MRAVILVMAVALMASSPISAWAWEGLLIAKLTPPRIYIWKSASALDEGQSLLSVRADRALLTGLVACMPESGTRVAIANSTGGYVRVTVIDGQWKGCRGVVDSDDLKVK
jgi:hypothetical protein